MPIRVKPRASRRTPIEWTERTWNPVRGCSPVSPGCKNCYAERTGGRFCKEGQPFHGFVQIGRNGNAGPHWTGMVELIPNMLEIPLHVKTPTVWFVNSMSDLFHEILPDEAIDRVFAVMALCPQHTFQVLTKRAKRMRAYCAGMKDPWSGCVMGVRRMTVDYQSLAGYPRDAIHFPLPNVWLGVSVEDRERKPRIDLLRQTPAAVRFISFEPLLEDLGELDLTGIDLAIWGGESGPDARPCDIAWIRNGMRQAERDGCRNFVKQLGRRPIGSLQPGLSPPQPMRVENRKGGEPSEWPEDLRVRETPGGAHAPGI